MHTGKILGLLVGAAALLGANAQAANTNCEILLRNVPPPGSSETLAATCQHKNVALTSAQFFVQNNGSTQSVNVFTSAGPNGTSAQFIGLNSAGAQVCTKTAKPGQSLPLTCTGAAIWRAIISYLN